MKESMPMSKSIRLKTVRKLIRKICVILPVAFILLGLVRLVPAIWLKIILGYCGVSILLITTMLAVGMYYMEWKEVKLIFHTAIGNYKELQFGNEKDVTFQMVIPCTSAECMLDFEEKYFFLNGNLMDDLYNKLFQMQKDTSETNVDGYLVSFCVNEADVKFDSLGFYIKLNGLYYMV